MRSADSMLRFLSIGTFVLDFFGYEFAILAWIYNWGTGVALGILGAMFVAGAILFFMGSNTAEAAAD